MQLGKRLRRLWRRGRWEADLADEVRIHREMAAEAARRGEPAGAFGSEAWFLEESRAVWGFGWFDSLGQDMRYALRSFAKTPLFALTVIAAIGLALGLNTAVFTVFNAYVLRPLAVKDPYSLYAVSWNAKEFHWRLSWRAYQDLLRQGRAFSDIAATEYLFAPLDGRLAIGQLVSGNYFRMLQPGAFVGRLIEPDDEGDVAVLSYPAWKGRFGGDPEILGRKILLRGQQFQVVGITTPQFGGVGNLPLDFWVPLTAHARVKEGPDLFAPAQPEVLELLARLKPDVSADRAKAALWAWAGAETAALPGEKRANAVRMISRATAITVAPQDLVTGAPIFVAFALVLTVACANVSNMMMARALARQREIGIRMSLGAGRARLVRQLLTESLMLAGPAAVAGFVVAQITVRFAQWLMFATLPPAFSKIVRVPALDPDIRVFGFLLAAALAATLLFGLLPALQTTRSSLVQANRGDFDNQHRPSRLRNALVAGQAMVCCLLLIYAVVTLRGVERTTSLDVGMRTAGIFDARLNAKYVRTAVERLSAQPGVEGVAAAWEAPFYNPLRNVAVLAGGSRHEFFAGYDFVSPEYFSVLGIPILRGRAFSAEEARGGAAVVVISQATARLFWPGRNALGETVRIDAQRAPRRGTSRLPPFSSARVIGIARDAANGFVGNGLDPTCLYFPTTTADEDASLLIAARGGKEAGRRLIQGTLDRIAPDAADQLNPLDEVLATMRYPFRVAFWIASFLAGVALLLTISGVYGVMSYAVSQRSKEIGIRMALGADSAAVVRMVVEQSMRMAGIGAAFGGAAALMVAPVFANQLQAIRPYEPIAYAVGLGVVVAAGLGAAILPGRRAVRIDPVVTLRCD